MGFKDQIAADMATFFNVDEFGAMHNIDGLDIACVIDEEKVSPHATDGIYVTRRRIFVKQSDLGVRPVPEQKMKVDGKYFYVVDCMGDEMLEIVLEAHST